MSASVNNVSLILNQQDANGINILNRLIGAITYSGTVGQLTEGVQGTGLTTLTLPVATVLQLYIRNLSTTANITVTATPQGGASAVLTDLGPGDVLVNWCAGTSATRGFTQIKLQSDTAATPFEIFMGG